MNIEAVLNNAFTEIAHISVDENPNILEIPDNPDLITVVPAYMLWCVLNYEKSESLVHDYTISCLAEFGRSKNPDVEHLNFKFLCNSKQRKAVSDYLIWCKQHIEFTNEVQIERTLKHWL